MTTIEVVAAARQIAEANGIETDDLRGLSPPRQMAEIRNRLSRHVLVLREELIGLENPHPRKQAERIAA